MCAGRKGWRSRVLKSWPAAPVVCQRSSYKVFGVQHTISRQRVGSWLVAVVPVLALFVGSKLSPQVVWLLVLGILEIVLSICARLPDVDDCVGDAFLGVEVHDYTVHESCLAIGM
jgi:hypothetical protein